MEWISVKTNMPDEWQKGPKPYVLAVDAKGRISVAYRAWGSWKMAKPIGTVTHWMPLPEPPPAE